MPQFTKKKEESKIVTMLERKAGKTKNSVNARAQLYSLASQKEKSKMRVFLSAGTAELFGSIKTQSGNS